MDTFSKRLKIARESAGLTQTALADMVGVQVNTAWRWERGDRTPRDKQKYKLASVLNTTVAYLIGETDDPTPPLQPERVGVSEVNQIHRNAPQPQIQERQPAPKDSGLTLDDASTPLILEYLWCRLKRDREQMTTEELKETLEKLYKCADYLANRQRKTKTA